MAITGIGGAFLRARDPEALYAWYETHLGLVRESGTLMFASSKPHTVVAFFTRDSDYFPIQQPAMLNFHVDDLDATLDRLAAGGVEVDPKRERYDFGAFGWFIDPEGNRVELWQPLG